MTSINLNSIAEYKHCAGRNCPKIGKNTLVIKYINKTGNFCDSCSKDLLEQELATYSGANAT